VPSADQLQYVEHEIEIDVRDLTGEWTDAGGEEGGRGSSACTGMGFREVRVAIAEIIAGKHENETTSTGYKSCVEPKVVIQEAPVLWMELRVGVTINQLPGLRYWSDVCDANGKL